MNRGTSVRLFGLAASLAATLGVSALGGLFTASSVGTWYQALAKPVFNPPDWVFAPVWITLYVLMALAAWRVWDRAPRESARAALGLYAIQLALNLGWTALFFGLRWMAAALVEIVVLLALILATRRRFAALDRWAGLLFIPYALWVAYAMALNLAIWWLNGSPVP
jgi:tryptophan-rich sensory protein